MTRIRIVNRFSTSRFTAIRNARGISVAEQLSYEKKSMHALLRVLFYETWWSYSWTGDPGFSAIYHWANIGEGLLWWLFAGLVAARFARHRYSCWELAYAAAFATFGLTDFREAWCLQSWLIWLKLFNLIALLWLRALVLRRFYPQSRLY